MTEKELSAMRKRVEKGMEIQDTIFYLEQNIELLCTHRSTNRMSVTLYSSGMDTTGVKIDVNLAQPLHENLVKTFNQSMKSQIQVLKQEFENL